MRIRAAVALGDGDAVARAYTAYAKTRGEGELDKDLLRDLAVATLGQAIAGDSAKLKVRAIEAVAEVELHALADQVADRMHDENEVVAAAAAAAVLNGYPDAPEIAEHLEHAKDPQARRLVLDAIGKKLGKMKGVAKLAIADLEKAAETDKDAGVRRTAIRWLGQLRDVDAHELLMKRQRDQDEGVRAAASIALARIGIGNLGELAKRAEADRALEVKLASIDLYAAAHREDELVRIAGDVQVPMFALAAAIEVKRTDLAQKAFTAAMASDDWTLRAGALNQATRALGAAGANAAAKSAIATDPELAVKLTAARVLEHSGDPGIAIEVFAAALGGDRAIQAAGDLADAGDPRGDATLAALVRDPKRPATDRVAAAAAHRAAHHVSAGLVAALTDSSPDVRVEAAAALAVLSK